MCKELNELKNSDISTLLNELMDHLKENGYAQSSLETYGSVYKRLRKYCESNEINVYTNAVGQQFMYDCYGTILGDKCRHKHVTRAVAMVTDFQQFGMIFKQQYQAKQEFSSGFSYMMEEFLTYSAKRNLAESTVYRYRHCLLRFESFLQVQGVENFDQLNIDHVNAYIESFSGYARNTVAFYLGLMKSLFKYAFENGYCTDNYMNTVPKVTYSQYHRLPTVFSEKEIEQILNSIDNNNPVGKRNYAVILIAARLGLRVSDIIGLRLEEIDWSSKTISVVQQKTGEPLSLPLPDDVGWAIIDYLKYGRPITSKECDYVFIRHNAPYGKLTSCFNKDIQRAVQRAGIRIKPNSTVGMHSFRHSLASNLLTKGARLADITQILGHATAEVTEEYLRITPALLQECALEVDF